VLRIEIDHGFTLAANGRSGALALLGLRRLPIDFHEHSVIDIHSRESIVHVQQIRLMAVAS
jgi:hypothetical protein